MTREEAAKICQSIKFILDNDDYSEEVEEALDMAIEALQQQRQEILPKHCIVPSSDAISSAKPYKIGYRNRTNGE